MLIKRPDIHAEKIKKFKVIYNQAYAVKVRSFWYLSLVFNGKLHQMDSLISHQFCVAQLVVIFKVFGEGKMCVKMNTWRIQY